MDFIRKYDIELEKEHYFAGETLRGRVVIENIENLRVTGVQLYLRGKAHVEWRITRAGERRTVKEDQYFIDEKLIVWGSESVDEGSISILPRGDHRFPFEFHLPTICLPCSFESRIGTVRYYLRVIIDIPYASPPQGLKYFTVIGPDIDCMDSRYTTPVSAVKQTTNKCLCCCFVSGPICLEASLEQTAYCCGQKIRVRCDVQNGSDQEVTLFCRLIQSVEFRINKGAFGLTKDLSHNVLELHSPSVAAHSTRSFHDLSADLEVPVMPPTMVGVCKIIEISYGLKIGLHLEKSGNSDDLHIDFPFVVATHPPLHPSTLTEQSPSELTYEPADEHVEGGIYVSPEFQLGQVYDGAADHVEEVILYRPVYICCAARGGGGGQLSNGHSPSSQLQAPTDHCHAAVNANTGGPSISSKANTCSISTRQQPSSSSPVAAHAASSSSSASSSHLPLGAGEAAEAEQRRRRRSRQIATAEVALKEIAMKEEESSSVRKRKVELEEASSPVQLLQHPEASKKEIESTRRGERKRETGRNGEEMAEANGMMKCQSRNLNSIEEQRQHHNQKQQPTDTSTVSIGLQSSAPPSMRIQTQSSLAGAREEGGGREPEARKGGEESGEREERGRGKGPKKGGREGGKREEGGREMGAAKGGKENGEREERGRGKGSRKEGREGGEREERKIVDEREAEESNGKGGYGASSKEKLRLNEFLSASSSSSSFSSALSKSVVASKADKQGQQQHEGQQGQQQVGTTETVELRKERERTTSNADDMNDTPGEDVNRQTTNAKQKKKKKTRAGATEDDDDDDDGLMKREKADDRSHISCHGDGGDVIGCVQMKCAEKSGLASVGTEMLPQKKSSEAEKTSAMTTSVVNEMKILGTEQEQKRRADGKIQSYQNSDGYQRSSYSDRSRTDSVECGSPTVSLVGTVSSSPSFTASISVEPAIIYAPVSVSASTSVSAPVSASTAAFVSASFSASTSSSASVPASITPSR